MVPLPSAVTHCREGTPQLPLKSGLALSWCNQVQAQDLDFSNCPVKPWRAAIHGH